MRALIGVGAGAALLAVVLLGWSWLANRIWSRDLARWRAQQQAVEGSPLSGYTPQTVDLYWDGVEQRSGRWSP